MLGCQIGVRNKLLTFALHSFVSFKRQSVLETFYISSKIRRKPQSQNLFSTRKNRMSSKSKTRSYKDALLALNTLQSNLDVLKQWAEQRRADPNADLRPQMISALKILEVDLTKLSVLHITGTKGKGSTCSFLESILRQHGVKTGLYTSPHLVSVRERIQLDGLPISQEKFAHYFWKVWDKLQEASNKGLIEVPPYFRFLTLLAFEVFRSEKVDVVVLEVGIGGRTDATNVVDDPIACAITPIGFDHMDVLGETLDQIAFEKSGIFKANSPPFTIPQPPEAIKVIQRRALELTHMPLRLLENRLGCLGNDVVLGLEGEHQWSNASLAVALAFTWFQRTNRHALVGTQNPIGVADLTASYFSNMKLPPLFAKGLATTKWPGRAQTLALSERLFLHMDGAHTPESAEVCMQWYSSIIRKQSLQGLKPIKVLLFNCAQNKQPLALLTPIKDFAFDYVIFTTNNNGIVHLLEDKRPAAQQSKAQTSGPSWQETIRDTWISLKPTQPNSIIVADLPSAISKLKELEIENSKTEIRVMSTGSLYLVGALLELLSPEMCDTL